MSGWWFDGRGDELPGAGGAPWGVVGVALESYPIAFRKSWAFCFSIVPANAQVEWKSGVGHSTRLTALTTDDSTG